MQQNQPLVRGLHEPGEFRDNCGFGLIAQMEGKPSHELLQTAIEALTCMTHRGGINADGKTGDGCGLLLQKPDSFFRKVAGQLSVTLPETYGVRTRLLSPDGRDASAQKAVLDEDIARRGLSVLAWRGVRIDLDGLGSSAMQSLRAFAHLLVGADGISRLEMIRRLFFA